MTKTRLFRLTWDNSRIPNLPPSTRYDPHEAQGTHYANGVVTLDIGTAWESMYDMERHFRAYGKCEVAYMDDEDGEAEQQLPQLQDTEPLPQRYRAQPRKKKLV